MAITLPQQIYNQFKGIREINGVNSGGAISALSAVNVEFFNSDIGGGVGIRTAEGSKVVYSLPTGYKGIKCFVSNQSGVEYLIVYAESLTEGALYYYDGAGTRTTIVDKLTVTGKANGITMQYGDYDVFIFTNGTDKYSVCFAQTPIYTEIEAEDNQGRTINWLSMTEWNGYLVVASDYGVHASHKNNIYTWDDVVEEETASVDSWYIDFGKRVTAVAAFATGLFIFTEEDISHLNASPNTSTSVLSSVAMNGCFSYESLVNHGTFLFFYDDKQKNIFYIQQTDTGLTQPAGPVAQEIQSVFTGTVSRCKLYSCIYSTKNEIWMIINDKTLIFDYTQKEFLERKQTKINAICKYSNRVYSINDDGEIRIEKLNGYNDDYVPSEYKTSIINMGSNTNLKKQKTPVLLVLNENFTNDFFVEITANYKEKNPKHIIVKVENQGVWGGSEQNQYNTWGVSYWCEENQYKKRVVELSTPQTWYNMSLKFYTEEEGQGFSIESIELKRLKEKTKTKGR